MKEQHSEDFGLHSLGNKETKMILIMTMINLYFGKIMLIAVKRMDQEGERSQDLL